jgi:hypothetical protein
MWRTSVGDRILTGAEAEVFRHGLASLMYDIEEAEELEMPLLTGVSLFDRLQYSQKLTMLEIVGGALLRESIACPMHTAVAEATIAAIFHHLETELDVEIDEHRYDLRRVIVAACKECGMTDELPGLRSTGRNRWRSAIESLTDQVLWDCDWQDDSATMEAAPDVAEDVKDIAGITDDYYTALAPDPMPEQLSRIRASLIELVEPALGEDEDDR